MEYLYESNKCRMQHLWGKKIELKRYSVKNVYVVQSVCGLKRMDRRGELRLAKLSLQVCDSFLPGET